MLPGYFEGLTRAGAQPLMLPYSDDPAMLSQALSCLDGVLISGGQDVDPKCYHQPRHPKTDEALPLLDRECAALILGALERDLPVLGICRGVQVLNTTLGGTLIQDLPSVHPGGVNHHQSPPCDRPVHSVTFAAGSPLHRITGLTRLAVNSYHHQAVDRCAPALTVGAVSEDGVIEALYMPERRFVLAVQWHPEFSHNDPASIALFKAFVEACESKSACPGTTLP